MFLYEKAIMEIEKNYERLYNLFLLQDRGIYKMTELSRLSGISVSTLDKIYFGERKGTLEQYRKIFKAFEELDIYV